ncbi:conjugal transfer protein TraX [Pseudomonas capeferrum]|nr:conjugal transfer protein TraX [Pseudomonas capeferrum]
MLTMVADHLRFLWPQAYGLFVPGRLAFPLFCLAIAVNVGRSRPGTLASGANARYLGWMCAFSVMSELPYRWLDTGSETFSVMPTLTLGLLVAWGVHHSQVAARMLGLVAAVAAAWHSDALMYGLPGVLLPAVLLLATVRGGLFWVLACLTAMAANLTNSWLADHPTAPLALLILASVALSVPLGAWLLRRDSWAVPRIGRWGYGFYPLHLLVIKALQGLS